MSGKLVPLGEGDRDEMRARFYAAVLDSNRLFAGGLDAPLEETLARFTQILVDRLAVRLAFIGVARVDGWKIRIKAMAGAAEPYARGLELSLDPNVVGGQGPTGTAMRANRLLFFDMERDAEFAPWRERAREYGLGGSANAPFGPVGDIRGLICLYRGVDQNFPPDVSDLLERLAEDVAIFLERRATQRDLTRSRSLYRALLNEGDLVLDVHDESTLLDQTCKRLIESGLFRAAWIGQPGEDGVFGDIARAHAPDLDPSTIVPRALRDVLARQAWEIGGTHSLVNELVEDDADPWDERADPGSGVAIPIERGGRPWGVMTLVCREQGALTGEFADLLVHVAKYLGHALDEVDLKERLELEARHESWLAEHDALTALPNRRALAGRLDAALERAAAEKTLLAIGIFDLDDFKAYNDTHGHAVGDALLLATAKRLQESLERSDFVARLGGDEFVLVFEGARTIDELHERFERIGERFETPITVADIPHVRLTGSLGIVFVAREHAADARKSSSFLRIADRALHDLKAEKTTRASFWRIANDPSPLYATRDAAANFVGMLLRDGGLRAAYQPIVAQPRGEVVGLEALARLVDRSGRVIQPAAFLRHLDSEDQYVLTESMLELALTDLERLDALGHRLWVSINVIPEVVTSLRFLRSLKSVLAAHAIEPQRVTLEILEESDFLPVDSKINTRARLTALKEVGVLLALDDVGSAYSSLLRLKDLPIDKFKLDRAFVQSLGDSPEALHFVDVLLELARNLRIDFIAEGVESAEIADALAAMRVPFLQGYAIARPMLYDALATWFAGYVATPWLRPQSVLGLYARHLHLAKLRRIVLADSAVSAVEVITDDPDRCDVGRSIAALGLLDTDIDRGHRAWHAYHAVADGHIRTDGSYDWETLDAVERSFRDAMRAGMRENQ